MINSPHKSKEKCAQHIDIPHIAHRISLACANEFINLFSLDNWNATILITEKSKAANKQKPSIVIFFNCNELKMKKKDNRRNQFVCFPKIGAISWKKKLNYESQKRTKKKDWTRNPTKNSMSE